MKKKISLVIPCYEEEAGIPIIYEAITAVAEELERFDFEFLFIDDGSKDQTMVKIHEIAAKDERVRFLSFSRNFGKESALYAGLSHASGDYIATMDADMQDPPSLLPEMIPFLESGEYDSVGTRRVNRKGEPPIRSLFARAFYKIMRKISSVHLVDGARDYRLMNRTMTDSILSLGEYNRFSKGIFEWVGFRTKWLEFENVERAAGETKWNFWGLLKYSMEGIISFSNLPLMISSYLGLFFTFFSFLAVLFIIIRKLILGDPVSGWASTVSIITFIGGIQLFCMGIMGQYLSKTYLEVKHRPIYILRESNISEKNPSDN